MVFVIRRTCSTAYAVLLLFVVCVSHPRPAAADSPPWPSNSVVYCVYPSIFSPQRNFSGVTAQLSRLKTLGVTIVWLMPVTPIGQPVNGHPAFGSPYAVQDYYGLNPDYGTEADLKTLVRAAHKLGLQVILDEVLNHTAWDNALITQHPEYYIHSDGDPKNSASIQQAFNYGDVAQLNYADPCLRVCMTEMLRFWLTRCGVDGFRFDTASNPEGPGRKIPADFWSDLGKQLRLTKPHVLLLGECETPDLALKPFALDYGWRLFGALKDAVNGGDASKVEAAWRGQRDEFPRGMPHLSLQDNWDTPRDVSAFGGAAGARAAAVFNFTTTGVPLLYNGMEIGNAGGGVNPHLPINWNGGDPRFPKFYGQLIALRSKNAALHSGTLTWLPNSAPSQLLSYTRSGGGMEFLIAINLSSRAAQATLKAPVGAGWQEVLFPGSAAHAVPPRITLLSQDFAVFQRVSTQSPR